MLSRTLLLSNLSSEQAPPGAKLKVVVHDEYIVVLGADGVAIIINLDEHLPKVISRSIKHIHDIFGGERDIYDELRGHVHFSTNSGQMFYIDSSDSNIKVCLPVRDIIHAAIGGIIKSYTNIRGEVEIESDDAIVKVNFPESVVAASQTSLLANAVTAITTDQILFLTVSGTIRFYHSLIQHGHRTRNFEEFTLEHWKHEGEEVDMKNLVVSNLDKVALYDVANVFAGGGISYVLVLSVDSFLIKNSQDHTGNIGYIGDVSDISDVSLSSDAPTLELLSDGRVNSDSMPLPYIGGILAISSSQEYLALIWADGLVLIKYHYKSTFETIPRLRLNFVRERTCS